MQEEGKEMNSMAKTDTTVQSYTCLLRYKIATLTDCNDPRYVCEGMQAKCVNAFNIIPPPTLTTVAVGKGYSFQSHFLRACHNIPYHRS